MKNLDSLILAHNQLSKVPANVFSHLPQLNSLELEGNRITYIDKDAFAGLEGERETNNLIIVRTESILSAGVIFLAQERLYLYIINLSGALCVFF